MPEYEQGLAVADATAEPAQLQVIPPPALDMTAIERVIVAGDLSKLSPDERWRYYLNVCQSIGLNPFTRPLEYVVLSGKMVLYANKGAAEQLRRLYGISMAEPTVKIDSGLVIVTVSGTDARGRRDSEIGAVTLPPSGEARANALMKALTKAKRRLTLSMCGLGMLDENEIDSIPNVQRPGIDPLDEAPKPTNIQTIYAAPDDGPEILYDAEPDEPDPPATAGQIARYRAYAKRAQDTGHKWAKALAKDPTTLSAAEIAKALANCAADPALADKASEDEVF